MPELEAQKRRFRNLLLPYLSVFLITATLVGVLALRGAQNANLTLVYLVRQDVILIGLGLAIAGACLWRPKPKAKLPALEGRSILLASMAVAVLVLLARDHVLFDYDLSRDEQLARFDAAIFSSGDLAADLRKPWGRFADALNTDFMLPVSERTGWVSGYLPLNAAIISLFDLLATSRLLGPFSVLLGGVALVGCARKLWPESRSATIVALLLYVGSGQVLLNAMTSYAMSLHLTANLCWLWLFLQRRNWADLLALAIAFVAVGLHQPLFHPMFAAPVLASLVFSRKWGRAGLYFAGYAGIAAFWFWWPQFSVGLTGMPLPGNKGSFLTRLLDELGRQRQTGLLEMIANLVRFVAWQHLLLLPLFLIGLTLVRKHAVLAGLALGIFLTIVVMAVILPYQGHGFGYRYLHGLIGNAILLAVAGYQTAVRQETVWASMMRRTTLAGLLCMLPLQLFFAHGFYKPYASASRAIDLSQSDYVIVDPEGAPFAIDLVINDPFLENRPLRLVQDRIAPGLITPLCANGADVSFLPPTHYNAIRRYFGMQELDENGLDNAKLTTMLESGGCSVR